MVEERPAEHAVARVLLEGARLSRVRIWQEHAKRLYSRVATFSRLLDLPKTKVEFR